MNEQPKIDQSELVNIVCCKQCKSMLWEFRVLKMRAGEIISTEYIPLGHNQKFTGRNTLCPKCGDTFYTMSRDGKPDILLRDPKDGKYH